MTPQAVEQLSLLERALQGLCASYTSEFTQDVRDAVRKWLKEADAFTAGDMLGPVRLGILDEGRQLKEAALDRLVELFNEKPVIKAMQKYLAVRHVLTLCGDDAEAFQKKLAEYLQE